jgi:DNA-binding transcriptional LysR family regulator
MKWTINDIETFLAVMEAGSISGAAARADLSKSVVSKRISDFEASLGAPLFTRHAGRIAPTDTGHALAERLRPALAELSAATESVAWGMAGLRGRLSISAPMSFGIRHLGPVIADFARAHPDLEITLTYDDQVVDLARSGFDVGLRIGAMRDSTLMIHKLCEDPRAIVASPDYLARSGPLTSAEDLPSHSAIGYLNNRLGAVWSFTTEVAPPRAARVVANNGEAIRDMAIAGLGLALLPRFIVHDALADGRLLQVLPELVPEPFPVNAVWPPIRHMPRKIRMFVDHLARTFGAHPPWLSGTERPGD